jgi:NADH-quinone oxidoreductase subunit C
MIEVTPGVQTRTVAHQAWLGEVEACVQAGFTFFDWLSAVDHTGALGDGTSAEPDPEDSEPGIMVVVHLMAVGPERPRPLARVLLCTLVPEGVPLPSLTAVFRGAAWHERETHEMFGVAFAGFDDGTGLGVRPLLLPPGFEGRPLRKSFMLAARASKPWPGAKEPGESGEGDTSPAPAAGRRGGRRRKRLLPPGAPDPAWGPRAAGDAPSQATRSR